MGKPTSEPTADKRARIDRQWAAMKAREKERTDDRTPRG